MGFHKSPQVLPPLKMSFTPQKHCHFFSSDSLKDHGSVVSEAVLGPSLDFCGQPARWINCITSCRVIVCSYCLVGLSLLEFPSQGCTMGVTLRMENGGFVLNIAASPCLLQKVLETGMIALWCGAQTPRSPLYNGRSLELP